MGAFLKDGYIYFHKTCANCGREYITRFINGKYCCTKCHDAGTNLSRHPRRNKTLPSVLRGVYMKFTRECKMCGKRFVAQKVNTRFCSSDCARRYRMTFHVKTSVDSIPEPKKPKDLMRIADVAEYMSMSRTSVYRAMWKGAFEVTEVGGVVLIKKSSVDAYISKNSESRKRIMEPESAQEISVNPVISNSLDYITISESLKLYGNELPSLPFLLRKSNLPFERFRNIRFYKRKDVDAFVRKRVRQNHPEIKEWYTVEEIMRAYDMERRSVYNFVFSYKIPKKKVYRTAYYSKKHVDEIFRDRCDLDVNYVPAQDAADMAGLELGRLYKVVKRLDIPSRNVCGRLWIARKELEDSIKLNKV